MGSPSLLLLWPRPCGSKIDVEHRFLLVQYGGFLTGCFPLYLWIIGVTAWCIILPGTVTHWTECTGRIVGGAYSFPSHNLPPFELLSSFTVTGVMSVSNGSAGWHNGYVARISFTYKSIKEEFTVPIHTHQYFTLGEGLKWQFRDFYTNKLSVLIIFDKVF